MGKLHEVLAAETDLGNQAKALLAKILEKFSQAGQYIGQQRRYQPLFEGGQKLPPEDKALQARVTTDLGQAMGAWGRWLDASLQKEITNQATAATVKIEGEDLLGLVLPATALLNLENKLAALGPLLRALPVIDTARLWSWSEGQQTWVAEPQTTYRTEKVRHEQILYEATPDHPAQVESYSTDDPVGEWTTIIHSGALTLEEKRQVLERWQELSLAVKLARQRANDIEANEVQVSARLITLILGGEVAK